MKFDLHIHTRRYSPDSRIDPLALIQRACDLELDGIVITEHDQVWPETELEELRKEAPGLVILGGVEVSAREGHFLVYGTGESWPPERGIGVAQLCRIVHEHAGVVVAAHPFRWGQPFDEILAGEQPELDGLELLTKNMDSECRRRAALIHSQQKLAGLGSSDAHEEEQVGICFTEFDWRIETGADLVQAIRGRQAVARARDSG
jgi:predicted metal-dependent phosphoesterase TrpH